MPFAWDLAAQQPSPAYYTAGLPCHAPQAGLFVYGVSTACSVEAR